MKNKFGISHGTSTSMTMPKQNTNLIVEGEQEETEERKDKEETEIKNINSTNEDKKAEATEEMM